MTVAKIIMFANYLYLYTFILLILLLSTNIFKSIICNHQHQVLQLVLQHSHNELCLLWSLLSLLFISLLHFYLIHILNMAPDCCNGPKTSMFPWGHQHCTRWTSCTLGCRSTCPGMSPPSRHAPCPGCCHQWCHKWTWWIQSTHQERRWELGSLLPDIKLDISSFNKD